MALKPEVSIGTGLGVAGLVFAIYANATPNIADVRAADPGNQDIDATRKMAAFTSVGVVSGVSLIAKDPTVLIIGGAMVIAMDWWHRHANLVNPETGMANTLGAVAGDTYAPDADAADPATYDTAGAL